MHHAPLTVAKNLYFDMAGAFDKLLQKQAAVFEIVLRQPRHALKRTLQIISIAAQLHANPTAARRAFEHHRKANADRFVLGFCYIGENV